ncbi:hypothetical protein, partial [Streptomyces sp. SP18CS02]|uniref:hypothetical protein n=1 Tax=Streptomyces sp. SP18CS02 TaxID=3002531 RepID=UPI002E7955BF
MLLWVLLVFWVVFCGFVFVVVVLFVVCLFFFFDGVLFCRYVDAGGVAVGAGVLGEVGSRPL